MSGFLLIFFVFLSFGKRIFIANKRANQVINSAKKILHTPQKWKVQKNHSISLFQALKFFLPIARNGRQHFFVVLLRNNSVRQRKNQIFHNKIIANQTLQNSIFCTILRSFATFFHQKIKKPLTRRAKCGKFIIRG